MTQQIRLSQFIMTYGPGAILEGREGPRIIPQPDIGIFSDKSQLHAADFEISDQRMSKGLLNGARIFRLPSNAELQVTQASPIYRTRPFPDWRLCLNWNLHARNQSILFARMMCPACHVSEPRSQEPIRFIVACPKGHADDVDWIQLVHHNNNENCQHTGWLQWQGSGSSISEIQIQCPRCESRKNFGDAYGESWPCAGRFPEREPLRSGPLRSGCSDQTRIIQRQASNLRVPELRTLFAVQPRHTELHNLLETSPIYSSLVATEGAASMDQLKKMLDNLEGRGIIARKVIDEIIAYPWKEVQGAISDILTPIANTYNELVLEEFRGLIAGSRFGIPPVRGSPPLSPTVLEINPNLTKNYFGPNRKEFRVVPVLRLRTVTAQVGYRRDVDTSKQAEKVDIGFRDPTSPGQMWYPGVQFLGEGIFIMLGENDGWHFDISGGAAKSWRQTHSHSSQYPDYVFRGKGREELDPTFVWWHTLSHLLIRAISVEAGYSTAAIRERVYLESDGNRIRGSILLYATQPGSEGTLGGLVALTPFLSNILGRCFHMLRSCSGDPLCYDNLFVNGSYNGAACYACLLISETSCEHRNMWLDRHVLGENLP